MKHQRLSILLLVTALIIIGCGQNGASNLEVNSANLNSQVVEGLLTQQEETPNYVPSMVEAEVAGSINTIRHNNSTYQVLPLKGRNLIDQNTIWLVLCYSGACRNSFGYPWQATPQLQKGDILTFSNAYFYNSRPNYFFNPYNIRWTPGSSYPYQLPYPYPNPYPYPYPNPYPNPNPNPNRNPNPNPNPNPTPLPSAEVTLLANGS